MLRGRCRGSARRGPDGLGPEGQACRPTRRSDASVHGDRPRQELAGVEPEQRWKSCCIASERRWQGCAQAGTRWPSGGTSFRAKMATSGTAPSSSPRGVQGTVDRGDPRPPRLRSEKDRRTRRHVGVLTGDREVIRLRRSCRLRLFAGQSLARFAWRPLRITRNPHDCFRGVRAPARAQLLLASTQPDPHSRASGNPLRQVPAPPTRSDLPDHVSALQQASLCYGSWQPWSCCGARTRSRA